MCEELEAIMKDEMIVDITMEEYVQRLQPDVRECFYKAYGKNLENMPETISVMSSDTVFLDMKLLLELLVEMSSSREQEIIIARYGLLSGYPMTLQETAEQFNIPEERGRQIVRKLFRKCGRHSSRRRRLKEFLG